MTGQHRGMRVVALLRGVNLGGSRSLKMADLRAVVESLGHTDVETYLQSGNVVFTPKGRASGDQIHAAIQDATGLDTNVLIRTGEELAAVLATNPYPVEDPTKVVVTFLASAADAELTARFDAAAFAPEELTVHGTEVYLYLPFGQGRSKLTQALAKLKTPGAASATTRNWRTVEALAAMTAE
ncbi:MAG: hypothetical protein AMXMBFR46_18360 [Acidimicrobiia bacterium]